MSSNTEPKRPQLPKIPTTGSFPVDSTPSLPTPTCVYCSEIHFSASCPKITDMCSRKAVLKRDKRCFTCLRKKHNSEQCDKSCRKCNRKHHQSICPEQTINSPRNASKPPHPPSGEQNNKAVDNGDHHFRECKPETQSIIANSHRDRDKWRRNEIDDNQIIIRQWQSTVIHHR